MMRQCNAVLESEDSSSGSEEGGEGKEGEEDGAVVVEWRPSGSSSALGDWERHTTVSGHEGWVGGGRDGGSSSALGETHHGQWA